MGTISKANCLPFLCNLELHRQTYSAPKLSKHYHKVKASLFILCPFFIYFMVMCFQFRWFLFANLCYFWPFPYKCPFLTNCIRQNASRVFLIVSFPVCSFVLWTKYYLGRQCCKVYIFENILKIVQMTILHVQLHRPNYYLGKLCPMFGFFINQSMYVVCKTELKY